MKQLISYILPVVYVLAFIFGIYLIITCNTGLFTSNINAAIIAGIIVSGFSGIFLVIHLWAWYKRR